MSISISQEDPLFNFVVKEGNGIKGLVDSGLKNVPQHYVQPPQHRINKKDAIHSLGNTAIDLSELDGPKHDKVVKAIAEAAETLGFFQVVNHGVPVETLEAVKDAAHRFFGQPLEKKAVYLNGVSSSPLVKYWTSFNPDREKVLEWRDYVAFMYTNDADALANWPDECKEAAVEYIKASKELVRKLMEVLMSNLGVTLEDSRLNELMAIRMVQMNFYPPCPNPELTVGVGRHSDIGLLTVLLQDGVGGLHVKTQGGKEEWIEIPPIPSALVINVGDTLEILSNGRYKSAEHRVQTTSIESRVSIPIFNAPSPAKKIGPFPGLVEHDGVARYRELSFGEYTNNFFNHAHEGKKSLEFALNSNST